MCEIIGHRPLCGPFNFKHSLLRQGTGAADQLLRLFWSFAEHFRSFAELFLPPEAMSREFTNLDGVLTMTSTSFPREYLPFFEGKEGKEKRKGVVMSGWRW